MKNVDDKYIYKIVSKLDSNKVIKVDTDRNKVVIHAKDDKDDQNWCFLYDESYDAYKIVNMKTDQVLRYESHTSTNIPLSPPDIFSIIYYWRFESVDERYFVIKHAADHQRVLDVKDSNASNGNEIILFNNNKTSNQMFELVKVKFKDGHDYELKKLNFCDLEENQYADLEDLKHKIFSRELFIKKWSHVAHMLGYAWCRGTASKEIGEDFTLSKQDDYYVLTANYRKDDPYADGYRAYERLQMVIFDVRLAFDPDSIELGKQTIETPEPIVIASTKAYNNTDKKATVTKEIEYTIGRTTSNSAANAISNSVEVASSFKVKIAGVNKEHSFTYNFGHEYSWGQQKDESEESKIKSIYSVDVDPHSSVPIHALVYKSKARVPYTATANLVYKLRMVGFLRYSHNAHVNHPATRPTIIHTFGNDKLSAHEDLYDQFNHRHIKGYSIWNYNWIMLHYPSEYVQHYMNAAISANGVRISGQFTNVDSSNVVIRAGDKDPEHTKSLGDEII